MLRAEPHEDSRDAEPGRGPMAFASGPTIPSPMANLVKKNGEDPGEVRQTHNVSSHSPFPDRFGRGAAAT